MCGFKLLYFDTFSFFTSSNFCRLREARHREGDETETSVVVAGDLNALKPTVSEVDPSYFGSCILFFARLSQFCSDLHEKW